jgi:tRNA dimethylallyltransferase
VIALFGPTAVGKTAVALALSARLRELGEDPVAVSADALQVYAGLETLTGAPAPGEQAQLEHRLISLVDVRETFSAGQYAQLAHAEIDELLDTGRRPIVLGGTGLYLRAALTELSLKPPPAPGVRERWTAELEQEGPRALHALLSQRAPEVAARIEPGDRQRVVRALELLEVGELTEPEPESELWTESARHPTLLIGLMMERVALYERIDRRVDTMVAAGAMEEVQAAAAAGASVTAAKALGFAELLRGDTDEMKRRTRRYARRQLTWMRKLSGVNVVDVTRRVSADVAEEVLRLWLREAE